MRTEQAMRLSTGLATRSHAALSCTAWALNAQHASRSSLSHLDPYAGPHHASFDGVSGPVTSCGIHHVSSIAHPTRHCQHCHLYMQCHPFTSGRYMFMHNGIIAGFSKIRRKLLEGLSEAAYDSVQSFHSDSAVSFALFLSFLPDMEAQQPPDVILMALQRALQLIGEKQAEAGLADCREYTSLLNFAVTDGATLIVTCCVSPDDEKPASLYYAEGTTFRCVRVPAAIVSTTPTLSCPCVHLSGTVTPLLHVYRS